MIVLLFLVSASILIVSVLHDLKERRTVSIITIYTKVTNIATIYTKVTNITTIYTKVTNITIITSA